MQLCCCYAAAREMCRSKTSVTCKGSVHVSIQAPLHHRYGAQYMSVGLHYIIGMGFSTCL